MQGRSLQNGCVVAEQLEVELTESTCCGFLVNISDSVIKTGQNVIQQNWTECDTTLTLTGPYSGPRNIGSAARAIISFHYNSHTFNYPTVINRQNKQHQIHRLTK